MAIIFYSIVDKFQLSELARGLGMGEWLLPTLIGLLLIASNIIIVYKFTKINRDIAPWVVFLTTCLSVMLVSLAYNFGKDLLGIQCAGLFGVSTKCVDLSLFSMAMMGGPIVFPVLALVIIIVMSRMMKSGERDIARKEIVKKKFARKTTKKKTSKA